MHVCMLSHFSCVQLCGTLWAVAHQSLLSMGFPRQEYWSGLPFPSPRESSWPRDRTHCLLQLLHCRRILHCWATREAWYILTVIISVDSLFCSHCSLGQPGPLLHGCGISSRCSRSCTSQFRVPFPSPKFPWQVILMRKMGKDNVNIQPHHWRQLLWQNCHQHLRAQ